MQLLLCLYEGGQSFQRILLFLFFLNVSVKVRKLIRLSVLGVLCELDLKPNKGDPSGGWLCSPCELEIELLFK